MFGDDPENTVRKMKEVIEDVTGIVIDDWAKCVEMEVDKIRQRLDALEVASRKANTEQPLVSPPSQSTESPAALARPECLAAFKMWLDAKRIETKDTMGNGERRIGWLECYEAVLQYLVTYDQGGLAKATPKTRQRDPKYA